MKIAFVTDSTANLTREQMQQFNIHVVPLSVIFGQEVYREDIDMTVDVFYDRLPASKVFPTTSQPSIGAFVEVFESLLQTHDVVMSLLLASTLSGTWNAAHLAAEQVNGRVIVVDSGIASYGIAGPMMDAVVLARQGATPEEICAYWNEVFQTQHSYFVVDTLEQLHRGGRIGGAAAVFGALLQIKPILTIVNGKVEVFEKVRTHRRAMERLLVEFDTAARNDTPLQVGVVHSRRLDDAEQLKKELCDQYPKVRADVSELGPVIGAHTGAGVMALLYYRRNEKIVR